MGHHSLNTYSAQSDYLCQTQGQEEERDVYNDITISSLSNVRLITGVLIPFCSLFLIWQHQEVGATVTGEKGQLTQEHLLGGRNEMECERLEKKNRERERETEGIFFFFF